MTRQTAYLLCVHRGFAPVPGAPVGCPSSAPFTDRPATPGAVSQMSNRMGYSGAHYDSAYAEHSVRTSFAIILTLLTAASAATTSRQPSRYFGQTPPGLTPERFAPGVVSGEGIEINGVFAPDFREFLFARRLGDAFTIFRSSLESGRWSEPQALSLFPGNGRGVAVDMAYSPDGNELYFLGRFKAGVAPMEAPLDIWVSRRVQGKWATAEIVPAPVSTDAAEAYPTMSANRSLYFLSDRPGGLGRMDIYRAPRLPAGRFGQPVNIGAPANSAASEGDTFVSPDEKFLIITSGRDGGFGQADLYVSFRGANGAFGEPINLGSTINTADTEFCPMVTPDGRYLFFSRRYGGNTWQTTTNADIFWVDVAAVSRLARGAR